MQLSCHELLTSRDDRRCRRSGSRVEPVNSVRQICSFGSFATRCHKVRSATEPRKAQRAKTTSQRPGQVSTLPSCVAPFCQLILAPKCRHLTPRRSNRYCSPLGAVIKEVDRRNTRSPAQKRDRCTELFMATIDLSRKPALLLAMVC